MNNRSSLFRSHNSLLMIIDVQSRLVPAIHGGDDIITTCAWLLEVARDLDVPVMMTEQYPQGLGTTVESLRSMTEADERFKKTHFSCVSERGFLERLNSIARKRIVVAGMEAHVCVMQTVLELLDNGYDVALVDEGIGARYPTDRLAALDRMRAAGAKLITAEMLFFEWLHEAGTPEFGELLNRHITGATGLDTRKQKT